MSLIQRCVTLLLAAAGAGWPLGPALAATAAATSVCAPVIGTREGMLRVVESLGASRRLAERCAVPRAERELVHADAIDAERPCLNELGMPGREIEDALRRGEASGDEVYQRTEAKDLLCAKLLDEFRQSAAQIGSRRAPR